MYIKRDLEVFIKNELFKGKVIVLYGARQTGKTTLVKHMLQDFSESEVFYIDCELYANNKMLEKRDDQEIFSLVKNYKIVVFDEAQTVKGIGSVLKSLFDHHKEVQYIATGSSSFDLANEVSEPLTGRSVEFTLYPLGLTEISDRNFFAERALVTMMRFGGYPGFLDLTEEERQKKLNILTTQYLYKNVLAIEGIRKPEIIVSLLGLLAHQIGNEVSYRELALRLEISIPTVQRYILLLENNFIIFRLKSFSRNKRREIVETRKIYFTDLGLRNALVDDFSPIEKNGRTDSGALFENCMILERLKYISHHDENYQLQQMFWRTRDQQEVDYIERYKGKYSAYEFKSNDLKKVKAQKLFKELYPEIPLRRITPKNSFDFVTGNEIELSL